MTNEERLRKVEEIIDRLNFGANNAEDILNMHNHLLGILGVLHKIGGDEIAHELIRISKKPNMFPVIALLVKAVGYDLLGEMQ